MGIPIPHIIEIQKTKRSKYSKVNGVARQQAPPAVARAAVEWGGVALALLTAA